MESLLKSYCHLLLWVLPGFFCLTPARAEPTDEFLHAQMKEHRIPGLVLLVTRSNIPIKTVALGLADVEQRVPVTSETVFEIGSVTKQFTAAGILLLAQEEKLTVDDSICRHLKTAPQAWTNITIRHLLTHTSGIKSYTGLNGFELTRHLTQEQFIRALAEHPLEFATGETWKYSNSGYNLLGFIIENVSGKSYWDFMQARIFNPLKMTATRSRDPVAIIEHRAHGYEQTNRLWINRDYDLTDVFSAGAMVSTIQDLAKWNAGLDADTLLSAASKRAMWTPMKLNNGKATAYGFGWNVEARDGRLNIGHGGATSGFSATIQRYPQTALCVIMLTNTDEQIASTLARKVASFYF
jgi:D-alanyl-D-alanine carboxypeptidase